jgi:hypothetical protein
MGSLVSEQPSCAPRCEAADSTERDEGFHRRYCGAMNENEEG